MRNHVQRQGSGTSRAGNEYASLHERCESTTGEEESEGSPAAIPMRTRMELRERMQLDRCGPHVLKSVPRPQMQIMYVRKGAFR